MVYFQKWHSIACRVTDVPFLPIQAQSAMSHSKVFSLPFQTALRPITSFVHSPSYQLSKHLAQILAQLVSNTDSHVTNSSEFVSFIQTQTRR